MAGVREHFGYSGGELFHVEDGEIDGSRSLWTSEEAGYPTDFVSSADPAHVVLAPSGVGNEDPIWVLGLDVGDERTISIEPTPQIGGMAVTDDGTVLVADYEKATVTGYRPDGTVVPLLAPTAEDLDSTGEPWSRPISLAALSDGRLVLIRYTGRESFLRTYDQDFTPRTLGVDTSNRSFERIAATDDDRLVVVRGLDLHEIDSTDERCIQLVDPDDRDDSLGGDDEARHVLLKGYKDPVTDAAAVGDDLYVLYADRLWRVEGALR